MKWPFRNVSKFDIILAYKNPFVVFFCILFRATLFFHENENQYITIKKITNFLQNFTSPKKCCGHETLTLVG